MEEAKFSVSRATSALVAIATIVLAYFPKDAIFHVVLTVIVIPLGCVWYGEEIGGFLSMPLDEENASGNAAGMFVVVLGWLMLVALLVGVIAYVLWSHAVPAEVS